MTRLNRMIPATTVLIGIALGGLGVAGAAAAQDAPPPAAPEAPAMEMPMEAPMAMPMDMPMHRSGPAIDFQAIDADGDGSLTRAELTARATERLGGQDGNADGAIDRAEIIAAMPAPRDSLMMVFAPDPGAARADRILAFMGATEAGRIEIAALSERQVNGVLALLDQNRDGAIALAEAEAAPMRGHGRMHGRDRMRGGDDDMRGGDDEHGEDAPGRPRD